MFLLFTYGVDSLAGLVLESPVHGLQIRKSGLPGNGFQLVLGICEPVLDHAYPYSEQITCHIRSQELVHLADKGGTCYSQFLAYGDVGELGIRDIGVYQIVERADEKVVKQMLLK